MFLLPAADGVGVIELYEAVTESGEILGRSASTLNLRKSATNAETTEYSSKIGAEVKGSYAGVEGKVYGETSWGGGTHEEEQNVRSTDESREKRETFSSSTNTRGLPLISKGLGLITGLGQRKPGAAQPAKLLDEGKSVMR